jgi:hypothetical protein
MNLIKQIVDFLESEGFGNAAKFLRTYYGKKQAQVDPVTIELLKDSSLSLSAKIMVIADCVVPPNIPKPDVNQGLPKGMRNDLEEIAYVRWHNNQRIRNKMQAIAEKLQQ